ncbi:MAG: flagellar type III secretion system pore protein FliP [Anaerolineales bacterium]|nr:flagellar type III secretion system pore protein FliP [Anaerolineales bacterium]
MSRGGRRILGLLGAAGLALVLAGCASSPELAAPGVTLSVDPVGEPAQVTSGVQLLVLMTVLSVAPSILILATSFTRIVIVLSMLRTALGTPTAPPNQVIVGLALLLTLFIMAPVYEKVDQQAVQPYLREEITQTQAFENAMEPVREFMFKQTRAKDIELFLSLGGATTRPNALSEVPTVSLLPAFVISELRTAFTMAFVIYVPFLVIEMVVSSVLLAMGMMMLPPSLVSLPFKVLLFVMVDGWYLLTRSLVLSFQ